MDKRAVRKVCIECWKDLTDKEEQGIKGLQIGVTGTLMVSCEPKEYYIRENRRGKLSIDILIVNRSDSKGTQQRFDITEILEDKPGALLSLLKVVNSVEVYKPIKIVVTVIIIIVTGNIKYRNANT